MKLMFPLLSGGTVSGLNDAGIETFEGDFASNVVRECAQNSLDAAIAQPVVVQITRYSIPARELQFVPQLRDVLSSCRTYWFASPKARKFFDVALQASSGSIDAIRVSDSNTSLVWTGPDTDRNGRWFWLG